MFAEVRGFWESGDWVLVGPAAERGELRFDMVARLSGLGTASNLRARMRRQTGLGPLAYRRRFGTDTEPTPAG